MIRGEGEDFIEDKIITAGGQGCRSSLVDKLAPGQEYHGCNDSGSNTIAMFRIHSDGSLEHVLGSPFPSGGIQPVSLALQNGNLYVANAGEGTVDVVDGTANTVVDTISLPAGFPA